MKTNCVWVIGSKGMLAKQVIKDLLFCGFDVIQTGHEVDITDYVALQKFSISIEDKVSFIVNCAAFTAVDAAQTQEDLCYAVNKTGALNVALVAKNLCVPLIYISTDYVFSGHFDAPIKESTPTDPKSVYGKSKLAGEKAVIKATQNHYIFRTSWLYGLYGKNFVYTMIKLTATKPSIKVVADQKGSPTNCATLSFVITKTICSYCKENNPIPYGIYNVTDCGQLTWFDFAKQIQKLAIKQGLVKDSSCVIDPCSTQEYNAPAPRPLYSVLDKTKIQNALDIKLPHWQKSLEDFIKTPDLEKMII